MLKQSWCWTSKDTLRGVTHRELVAVGCNRVRRGRKAACREEKEWCGPASRGIRRKDWAGGLDENLAESSTSGAHHLFVPSRRPLSAFGRQHSRPPQSTCPSPNQGKPPPRLLTRLVVLNTVAGEAKEKARTEDARGLVVAGEGALVSPAGRRQRQ